MADSCVKEPDLKIVRATEGDWLNVFVKGTLVYQGHTFGEVHLKEWMGLLGVSVELTEQPGETML